MAQTTQRSTQHTTTHNTEREHNMTNAMIIFNESVRLMEEGKIKGTGKFITVENEDGTKTELELPEELHTFQKWKELGYSVKKGEKAKATFSIWKHTTKMLNTNTGNAETDKMNQQINDQGGESKMFMKLSAFFTFSQVQPIKAK
jgi:hypothetical protein